MSPISFSDLIAHLNALDDRDLERLYKVLLSVPKLPGRVSCASTSLAFARRILPPPPLVLPPPPPKFDFSIYLAQGENSVWSCPWRALAEVSLMFFPPSDSPDVEGMFADSIGFSLIRRNDKIVMENDDLSVLYVYNFSPYHLLQRDVNIVR
jgi:hypothetical protein